MLEQGKTARPRRSPWTLTIIAGAVAAAAGCTSILGISGDFTEVATGGGTPSSSSAGPAGGGGATSSSGAAGLGGSAHGGGGNTASGGGGNGTGGTLCEPTDCPTLGFDCGVTDDGCGHPLDCGTCQTDEFCEMPTGMTAGNCRMMGCNDPMQCPDPGECRRPTCTGGFCGVSNDQDGTQCTVSPGVGGTCSLGQCFECFTSADCGGTQSICDQQTHRCISPTCTDGSTNGNETDTDCGGGNCPGCGPGKHCNFDTDCASGLNCNQLQMVCM